MKIKKIDVRNEADLRSLILSNPDAIEEGITFVPSEVFAHGKRRIDLAGTDKSGSLVIVELKDEEADDEAIWQIVDYADYIFRHFRSLFEQHPTLKTDSFNPYENLRVIVIATDFDETFKRIVPHIWWEIEAFKYQAIQVDKDTRDIVCLPVDIPDLPYDYTESPPTIDSHLEYITKDLAREAAQNIINHLQSKENVIVVPTQSALVFKKAEQWNFVILRTYRNFLRLWYRYTDENGETLESEEKIESVDEISDDLKEKIQLAYDSVE